MDVKHQVFVSSPYKDLIEERKAVIHALLELDCIPAGMELFPAADEDAWTLIKEVIDDCDYYVLILAGKYGSTNADGVSFTEMEFDYAAKTGKPIMVFLHQDVDQLSAARVEKTEVARQKLDAFRTKAQLKHCKFWLTAEDLGGKVSRGLVQMRKKHPALGWVPGRYALTDAIQQELLQLRNKVALLQEVTEGDRPPKGSEQFAQGTDSTPVHCHANQDGQGKRKEFSLSTTWDKLFAYCGPAMLNECSDDDFVDCLRLMCLHLLPVEVRKFNTRKNLVIPTVVLDRIRVQLQAIGLVTPGSKKRAVADNNRYWALTQYGRKHLVNISAKKRIAHKTEPVT